MDKAVKTRQMTPIDFCIVVYWIHGMTIGQIYARWGKRVGKTKAAIRGVTGKLQCVRSDMSMADRQKMLDHLLMGRLDDGLLPAEFFTAIPVKTDKPTGLIREHKKPKPEPEDLAKGLDLESKAGKIEYRRRRTEYRLNEKKKEDRQAEIMRNGGAERGKLTHPFEYLSIKGLLADPANFIRGGVKEDKVRAARETAGRELMVWLESQYGSGMKTQSFEGGSGGGSGAGVIIHASQVERTSTINALRSMMGSDVFRLMERLFVTGEFVWRVPSKKAQEIILQDIRKGLDCVVVINARLSVQDFATRWGYIPRWNDRDPDDIYHANRVARNMMKTAQRQAR